MASFVDTVDRMNTALGNRLEQLAPAGQSFGGLVGQPEQKRLNWGALLSGAGSSPAVDWTSRVLGGYNGGLSWANAAMGGNLGQKAYDLSGFDNYNALKQDREARDEAKRRANQPLGVSQTLTPSGGAYGNHEQYRQWITQYAQANGIDPDALAAILQIESDGTNPRVVSSAGARGLGQIMPETWAGLADPGDDPFDAQASIKNAAKYYAGLYRQFGDYALAAAAYQGGPGAIVNGRPRNDINDGNLTPEGYAAQWTRNYQGIKAAAPKAGASGLASIWGGLPASVTQEYGAVTPGINQGIYNYGADYGLAQGHTGADIGVKRGTALYMPTGLTGTVEIAGGTQYFRDEDYGDTGQPGKGELRIRLSNGDILILGHTSRIDVRPGQQVSGGQLVGLSGSASGDHLHLEVRRRNANGTYSLVNPREYFGAQQAAPTPQRTGGDNTGIR